MAYTDLERQETLIRLAINKYDYHLTSEQTGISIRTLRRWSRDYPKMAVPELLERAIERLLMVIPDQWNAKDWGIVLGILLDKWLLAQGEPTQRTEQLLKQFYAMNEDEKREIVSEAERIIQGYIGPDSESCD